VTDTTGAVIPGVKVVVKDLNQGTERDITSNGAGLYDSGPIVANDRFTITFSREGFGSLQRGPMVLEVGVTGMNVQLAVGQTTQQVVVNTEAPLLETTSAELSSTLPTETLQTLPRPGPRLAVVPSPAAGHIRKRGQPGQPGDGQPGSQRKHAVLDCHA